MEQSTGTSKDINISLSVLDRTRSNKLRINIEDLNNTLNFHLPVTKTSAYKAPADKEGLLCLYIGHGPVETVVPRVCLERLSANFRNWCPTEVDFGRGKIDGKQSVDTGLSFSFSRYPGLFKLPCCTGLVLVKRSNGELSDTALCNYSPAFWISFSYSPHFLLWNCTSPNVIIWVFALHFMF